MSAAPALQMMHPPATREETHMMSPILRSRCAFHGSSECLLGESVATG